jgi:hypothetical protein
MVVASKIQHSYLLRQLSSFIAAEIELVNWDILLKLRPFSQHFSINIPIHYKNQTSKTPSRSTLFLILLIFTIGKSRIVPNLSSPEVEHKVTCRRSYVIYLVDQVCERETAVRLWFMKLSQLNRLP